MTRRLDWGQLPAGYNHRPAALSDLQGVVDVFNACTIATTGVQDTTTEELRAEWATPDFSLDASTQVVLASDGTIAAYMEVYDVRNPPVHPVFYGMVHPEHTRRGIGTQLMLWGLDRVREGFSRVEPGIRIAAHASCVENDAATIQLYRDFGFRHIRTFYLMNIAFNEDPLQPSWKNGVQLHHYRHPEDMQAVFQAEREAFRDHWGYTETPLEEDFARWRHHNIESPFFHPRLWFVAKQGDQVVGVVRCLEESYEDPGYGWVRSLSVRRHWRKQGIGLALLQHAFTVLHAIGKVGAGLGVDSTSPTGATQLYTRAGMNVKRIYPTYELELRPGRELSNAGQG